MPFQFIRPFRRLPFLLLATILGISGCDSGGDDDDQPEDRDAIPSSPVTLSSEADVQREIGNIVASAAAFQALVTPASPSASNVARSDIAMASTESVSPKVATTVACTVSGSVIRDSGSKLRNLRLFPGTSATVNFETFDNSSCRANSGQGIVTSYGGFVDRGSSAPDAQGTSYLYGDYGRDGTPSFLRDDGPGANFNSYSTLGSFEQRTTAVSLEGRMAVDQAFDRSIGGVANSGRVSYGDGVSAPFVYLIDASGVRYTGRYGYTSARCDGGVALVATPAALAFDQEGFPIGGQLRLTAGTSVVTITFQNDGGSTYQIEGGATGALTREEVRASVNAC